MGITRDARILTALSTDTLPTDVPMGTKAFLLNTLQTMFRWQANGITAWFPLDGGLLLPPHDLTEALAGTGSTSVTSERLVVSTGGTAASTALRRTAGNELWTTGVNRGTIDWTKPCVISLLFATAAATTNGISRVTLGKATATGVGNPGVRALGIRISNLTFVGLAHNGTSLDAFGSTTLTANRTYFCQILSDGAGNVVVYLNGVLAGASGTGPAAAGTAGDSALYVETDNGADAADHALSVTGMTVNFKR